MKDFHFNVGFMLRLRNEATELGARKLLLEELDGLTYERSRFRRTKVQMSAVIPLKAEKPSKTETRQAQKRCQNL